MTVMGYNSKPSRQNGIAISRTRNKKRHLSPRTSPPAQQSATTTKSSKQITRKLKHLIKTDPGEATRYFHELRSSNLVDSYHYAVMIEEAEDLPGAMELLEELRGRGLQEQCACHNSILKKICMMGQMEEAEKYFLRMKGDASISPNYRTYCHLILAHSGSNESRCEELFEEMRVGNLSLGYGRWQELVKDLRIKMETTNLQDKLRSSLEGPVGEFERLLGEGLVDTVTFNLVLNSSKTAEEAEETWRRLQLIDLKPDVTSYKIFLKILCSHHKFQQAEEVMEEAMQKQLENNKIFTRLISSYSDAGRGGDADRIFQLARARGFLKQHETYESVVRGLQLATYKKLLRSLIEMEDHNRAVDVLIQMLKTDVLDTSSIDLILSVPGTHIAYDLLLKLQAQDIQLEAATTSLLLKTLSRKKSPHELSQLISAFKHSL